MSMWPCTRPVCDWCSLLLDATVPVTIWPFLRMGHVSPVCCHHASSREPGGYRSRPEGPGAVLTPHRSPNRAHVGAPPSEDGDGPVREAHERARERGALVLGHPQVDEPLRAARIPGSQRGRLLHLPGLRQEQREGRHEVRPAHHLPMMIISLDKTCPAKDFRRAAKNLRACGRGKQRAMHRNDAEEEPEGG
jgi:hypothetical protein